MSNFNQNTGQLTIEQYLPHNYVAEKIILSSILINSEALEIVFRRLKVETFYFKNHQELYKTIGEMHTKQIPIDAITLNTYLQDNGRLEKIGGTKILIDLLNSVPNLIYLEQYINLIHDEKGRLKICTRNVLSGINKKIRKKVKIKGHNLTKIWRLYSYCF